MEPPLNSKLSSLCLISQKKLECILVQCGEKKDLIIDPALIKPFERICGVSWLRQHGIDKIYKMDLQLGATSNPSRLYLIPACVKKYKCVLDQISSLLSQTPALADQNCFHVAITPKVQSRYEMMLENRGLFGIVKLYSFGWEFMMLDEGFLSLEIPYLYKQTFVDQDQSLLSSVSMALWSLFHVIGRPKVSFAVGKLSTSVLDIMEVYSETFTRDFSNECTQEIGALVVMDRNQDYASSLLTPATYSGLLNEIFSIKCGQLDLNVKETKLKKGKLDFKLKEPEPSEKTSTMILDSSTDSLYGEVKHRHFSEVLGVLSAKAKTLKKSDVKELDIREMKHFVSTKLQQITLEKRNLVNHVLACETIISEMSKTFESLKATEADMVNNRNKKANFNFIDEHFGTDVHSHYSLRLMCLLSLTQGLTSEEYNTLVTKYLHAFGHKHLSAFSNLVNAGLLVQPVARLPLNIPKKLGNISDHLPKWQNTFQTSASKLKQLPSETDKMSKTCPSYVFHGGYIPLLSVLCNTILTSETLSEVMTKLSSLNDVRVGGQILDKIKKGIETLDEKISNLNLQGDLDYGSRDSKSLTALLKNDSNLGNVFPLKPKCVLVYVIGGVNFAEIAACDIIQRITGSKILVASDCLVSGSELIAASL